MDNLTLENWKSIWGIIIIVGLPLLYFLVGLVIKKREQAEETTIPPKLDFSHLK